MESTAIKPPPSNTIAEMTAQREARAARELTIADAIAEAKWLDKTPDGVLAPNVAKDVIRTLHAALQRAAEFFEWIQNDANGPAAGCLWHARQKCGMLNVGNHELHEPSEWPLENVWMGVTVEDQKRAHERLPYLLKIPAAVHWVSYEPALELVDFTSIQFLDGDERHRQNVLTGEALMYAKGLEGNPDVTVKTEPIMQSIDWIVFGGESAQTRTVTRECAIEWARITMQACAAAKVAFFMKQAGTRPTWQGHAGYREHWPEGTSKNDTGRGFFAIMPPAGETSRYKFHKMQHLPEDLRVQEFPE